MRRRHAACAGAIILTGALTACGAVGDLIARDDPFTKESAESIFAAASEDMAAVDAFHVSGDVTQDGKKASIDLSVSRSGECRGSMSLDGKKLELLVADKRAFFRPGEGFFRDQGQSPAQAKQSVANLGGRWVEDASKKLADSCDFDELLDMSGSGVKKLKKALPGTVSVGDVVDVAGTQAVPLSSTGKKGDFAMYVAVDDPHHIVQLTAAGSKEGNGSLVFTDHGFPLDTQVPPPEQILGPRS